MAASCSASEVISGRWDEAMKLSQLGRKKETEKRGKERNERFFHSSAKTPFFSTNSACEPDSTISPFESTRMMSALTMVESLRRDDQTKSAGESNESEEGLKPKRRD